MTTQVAGGGPMDDNAVGRLTADFEALYERKVRPGVCLPRRWHGDDDVPPHRAWPVERPRVEIASLNGADPGQAESGGATSSWNPQAAWRSRHLRFRTLAPGNIVAGPAVIHTPITTIVVQSGQSGRVDAYRNTIIERD